MKKNICTGAQILKIVPNMAPARAEAISDAMLQILPYFKIYTLDVLPDFIAQVAHESGGFRLREESLNYKPERLIKVWPKRFKTLAAARLYSYSPVKLANLVYGGRMGNAVGNNDGYDNRGAGFIMITGKEMAVKAAKYFGFNDPTDLMARIRNEDYWALSSAAWLFAVEKNLIPYALKDDIETISLRINGGLIGFTDRKEYFERAKKVIK